MPLYLSSKTMKFISWNVNGFRACLDKGFGDFFAEQDADFVCIQETKMQPGQAEFKPEGYYQYWYSAEKKGYSGTAIFTKRELARLSYRMEWEDALRAYICELDQIKPVIYCGDLNVAHEEIDLKNPKTNHKSAGFSDEEREKFSKLLSAGFADTFRTLYPETVKYSWWSYMMNAREKNVGWRSDYFVVSNRLMERVRESFILNEIMGSDHCPVGIEIDI